MPKVRWHTGSVRSGTPVPGPWFSLRRCFKFHPIHCTHDTYSELGRSGEGTV